MIGTAFVSRSPRPGGYRSLADARAAVAAEERGRVLCRQRAIIARLAELIGVRPAEVADAIAAAAREWGPA